MSTSLTTKDTIIVLRFLALAKHACESDGVSGNMGFRVMLMFTKDGPASSMTARMNPREDE